MPTFTYEFDELPLAIVNGIEAGFINGQAEIDYVGGGYWSVDDITIEGFGERVDGKRLWPQVPAPEAIAKIIRGRLTNEWSHKVQDAVNEQIDQIREAAAE